MALPEASERLPVPCVLGVAFRNCPRLPPTIAERITDYRAQRVADWVMYRKALASAAVARGWPVHDAKKVLDAARQALSVENLDSHFMQTALGGVHRLASVHDVDWTVTARTWDAAGSRSLDTTAKSSRLCSSDRRQL